MEPPKIDPKQGEREYFARIGATGRSHAARKPFGDENCVQYLINLATLMSLMRPPPARIAEFGCGSGWLCLLLAERGYTTLGIDISPDAIALAEAARVERGLHGAQFRTADYEEIADEPGVDYIIFHDALHHAESEKDVLARAYSMLKPGGMVICIEPGEGHSRSPSSRLAVETYGVHEKDMAPRTILHHARTAGFRKHLVLPWPWFYMRSVYRPGYATGAGTWDLRGKKLLSFFRMLLAFFRTRDQGLVVLIKD